MEINITIKIDANGHLTGSASVGEPPHASLTLQAASIEAAISAMEELKKLLPAKK